MPSLQMSRPVFAPPDSGFPADRGVTPSGETWAYLVSSVLPLSTINSSQRPWGGSSRRYASRTTASFAARLWVAIKTLSMNIHRTDQIVSAPRKRGFSTITAAQEGVPSVALAKTDQERSIAATRFGRHVEIDAAMKRPGFETSPREPANAGGTWSGRRRRRQSR